MTFRERFWGPPGLISPLKRRLFLAFFGLCFVFSVFQGVNFLADGAVWKPVVNFVLAALSVFLFAVFYFYPKYSARNQPVDE